jgi:RNA polymerase sigma-70 factor (ECF subfamily)
LVSEDLTADVFLKAWGALSRYRERGYPFSAFLFKIARNALTDFRRKNLKEVNRSKELIESLNDRNKQISDEIVKRQKYQNLWYFLGELRENYRLVLVFRFINGLTTREISRIMRRSEGSIRVLQHRALSDLRMKMDHYRKDS